MEEISSLQNKYVKLALSLRQRKRRESTGLFVAEGVRLIEEVIASSWKVQVCIFTENAYHHQRGRQIIEQLAAEACCKVFKVPEGIYKKITDTDQPQGLMVLVEKRQYLFKQIVSRKRNPLIVILDSLQDPGNVGTIIRTADAAGCSGVLMTKGCTDLFSSKTVRAGMGSIFHLPIIEGLGYNDIISLLSDQHILLMVTALKNSELYFSCDFKKPVAIVFGNEGNGVEDKLLNQASTRVRIPILGKAESLNVSASASVILYEAVRQRLSSACVS